MPTIMKTNWIVAIELCDVPNPETKMIRIYSKEPCSKAYIKSCIKDAMDKTWQTYRNAMKTISTNARPYCINSILQTLNSNRDYELSCQIVQADFAMSDIE